MIINMTTFANRQKHYIDRTLESLFKSDGRDIPLNLIVGSNDTSHVERYRNVATVVEWDQEAERQARPGNLRRNCNVNAIRALQYGDDDHCLCCEDDITFAPDWYSQLMLTVAEIDRPEYVLNLGQRNKGDQSPGKRYTPHTQPYLCGAQGIFYPNKRLRTAVAHYVQENIAASTNDDLIGIFAKRFAALYNTTSLLVGHIGHTSCFDPTLPAGEPEGAETSQAPQRERSSERHVVVDQRADQPSPSATKVADVPRDPANERVTGEILMALLRASLGTGPLPDAPQLAQCDWKRFSLLARFHGLVPILYRALRERAADVPADWLQVLKAQYVSNAFHNQLAQMSVDEIGRVFSDAQIPVIVMKGAALLRTLYDDQGLRVLGDVDLLVDERDFERADAQLQRRGLKLVVSHEEELGSRCHFHYLYLWQQPRSVPVELHWRLFERYQPYVFDLEAVRAQARPLPGMPPNVMAMAPEHELAHLCVHLERHAVTYRSLIRRPDWCEFLLLPYGFGRLAWLYDIALYLQRRSELIDWDRFVDMARRWAMDAQIYATFELSRRALGVGPPPKVLQALNRGRPRLIERLAHSVVLAAYRAIESQPISSESTPRSRWLKQRSDQVLGFAHTWISVFPNSTYLQAKYATPTPPRWLRGTHLREVVPELWAETRDRFRSTPPAPRPPASVTATARRQS